MSLSVKNVYIGKLEIIDTKNFIVFLDESFRVELELDETPMHMSFEFEEKIPLTGQAPAWIETLSDNDKNIMKFTLVNFNQIISPFTTKKRLLLASISTADDAQENLWGHFLFEPMPTANLVKITLVFLKDKPSDINEG